MQFVVRSRKSLAFAGGESKTDLRVYCLRRINNDFRTCCSTWPSNLVQRLTKESVLGLSSASGTCQSHRHHARDGHYFARKNEGRRNRRRQARKRRTEGCWPFGFIRRSRVAHAQNRLTAPKYPTRFFLLRCPIFEMQQLERPRSPAA